MKITLPAMAVSALAVSLTLAGCDRQESDGAKSDASTATNNAEAPAATEADTRAESSEMGFDALSARMVKELWQLFPSWAVSEGYYAVADQLQIPDDNYREQVLEFARSYREQFSALDAEALDPNDRSDLVLIQNFLNRLEWEITEFQSHLWNPAEYNVSHPFALILNTDYAPLDERLRTFSERLQKVPAYYDAAENTLEKPASPQLVLAIQQNEGAMSVFGEEVEKKLGQSGLTDEEKKLFQERLEAARKAIQEYITYLQTRHAKLEDSQDYKDFRIGEELYEQKFKYEIQIGMTGKELYERALADKEKLHDKMEELAGELWPKYYPDQQPPEDRLEKIGMVLEKLSEHHATKETFKAEVEKQIPELVAFVKEKDLLTLDEDKPLVVRTTPPYMRGFSVASINAPGPYDKGANTYYNVMPIEEFSDDRADSLLKEYNKYLMQILNIHEAIPGHYTQLVYANKSPSLIKSILGNGAMVEGWAVYTEQMMLEAGYGDFSPELWLMYYKWRLRVVINTILDYEIQVKGIDEERAMDLMVRQGFQQKAEAMGKWRRATLSQVQLTSYYAGYADILALRKEMKEKLGDDFDLKAFHEKFLSYGNAPVPVIRELMLAELQ
ncbi:DUF885 domain-containing protein [Microbulbifer flavimaris]|uniref:DUF885 domain-containing protein n=1 Tax=Microbulbifer flavimaris TaxID=1781068 RepID=A0ABX4HWP4_9GAMM|nr:MULTISPECIES: DUF885 domain-containing protein [Microbulbifer]KUJ81617.1 hypothetical protein AVO43_13830 [Microbulbifer sp. ZGT114]PCO04527.1 DUF885 domain-containing protein [Microbulbifer flavimaris]